jgi:hypothetical protein
LAGSFAFGRLDAEAFLQGGREVVFGGVEETV